MRILSSLAHTKWALAALLFLSFAVQAKSQVMGFPIYVDNPSNFVRNNVAVRAPVPIPLDMAISNPNSDFLLVDDLGNPVEAAAKVTARWGGKRWDGSKRVKWTLLSFNADLPANSTRTYYVVPGSAHIGQLVRTETANEYTIDTGTAVFKIDKLNFSFFKEVKIGGTDVIAAPGSLDILDVAGASVMPVLTSSKFEYNSSVRTIIRQSGNIPSLGLDFTIRYYFYTGHSDVKVEFRLENQGNYGQIGTLTGNSDDTSHFDSLKLSLKVPDSNGDAVTSTDVRDLAGAPYVINQNWATPLNALQMEDGFFYREKLNGTTIFTGGRFNGALALNSTAGSISVATDRFWQNYPKAFEVDGDTISLALFPSFGFGPVYRGQYGIPTSNVVDLMSTTHYRFEGGRWKTHTMNINFRSPSQGGFSMSEVYEHAESTNAPILGRPGKSWPFQNWAFGDLLIERRNWTDASQIRWERMMDTLAHDSAADQQDALGQIGLPKFRSRGGTYGSRQMYGWENFGDIAWGDGFSSNHYDLNFGVLINWFRTGDYAFFDMARDMSEHRRDYDQNHTTHASSPRRGGQVYEKGYTHGNYNAPEASHTWVHGLLLYYITTGDEGAYESALEVGEFYKRQAPENWSGWWGARILGWQLEGLTNLYNYIGDPAYLTEAHDTMERWKVLDVQRTGSDGLVYNPGWSIPHAQSWMHAIVLNALCKYYLASWDQTAVDVIQKMAILMRDSVIKDTPTGPMNARTTATVWRRIDDQTYRMNPSVHHVWVTSQALAWSSIVFFDPSYMAASRTLFQSVTRYYQHSETTSQTPQDYNDPASYDKISFRMQQFPNSETKIMSNIALWGQAYNCADALWTWSW